MSNFIIIPPSGSPSWRNPVSTAVNLPANGNAIGDAIVTQDTSVIYIWNGVAWVTPSGGGTVTSVSVSTVNGFAGSSSGGTTPVLTLSTTVTGILNGNGTAVAAAVAGNFPTLNQDTTGHAGLVGTTTTMLATTGAQAQSFYNTTYNAWFDWIVDRWVPSGIPDPRHGFIWAPEDFNGGDRIGSDDWGSNSAQLAGGSLSPGLSSVSISAASNIFRQSLQLNSIQLGTMDLYLESSVSTPTLSNGTDAFSWAFGLNDGSTFSATSACTDGAYFSLDPTSGNFKTNTSSNGTLTSTTTTFTPSANTFYRLTIFIQASSQVLFYVNGSLVATHTTNIPTGAGRQTGVGYRVDKILGSGALNIAIDYFYGYGFFNGQRVA